jgi:hypothetical protein
MAAVNTDPIYSRRGSVSNNSGTAFGGTLLTATGDYTGASANHILVFTADATNGSYLQRLRFKAIGTNTATVARIYINNGSSNTTATNNIFYGELALPGTAATNTTSTLDLDYPLNFAIPAGFKIYVGLGTTVAAGWICTPIAGDY